MEWIALPKKSVKEICGLQKRRSDCNYRLVRHCITVSCEEGILYYQTLTGALALLASADYSEEDRNAMIENWFLVPEDFDEQEFSDQLHHIYRVLNPKGKEKTSFTILTTTDCNARCFYCYEMGIKRIPMTPEIAMETAAYICRVSRGKPVKLRWFGGEPLYNREVIDIICNTLKENGTEYESSMISNGFYLDEETARHAVQNWNLKKVQITIDGPESIYNRTKAYIDADKNPFERVMRNIQTALNSGIRVLIRLNMDAANAEPLLHLADDLARRFAEPPKPDVYVALLYAYSGKIHQHDSDQMAEKDYFALCERLAGHGLQKTGKIDSSLYLNRCMADDDASEVILPDGRVGKCEHIGENMITGHIRSDKREENVIRQWKEPLSVPECRDCALYPQCRKLRLCEHNRDGCSELERKIYTEEIKKQILTTFSEYKAGGQ